MTSTATNAKIKQNLNEHKRSQVFWLAMQDILCGIILIGAGILVVCLGN